MSTIIGHDSGFYVHTFEGLREALAVLSPPEAARTLLGCHLVTSDCRVQLVEVEAYGHSDDPGSHAHRGPTPRNNVMYQRPGLLYMYFNYGNHWMANVVCRPEGEAAAILLRAALPLEGLDLMAQRRPKARRDTDLCSGPGKLAAALALDNTHYGLDLLDPESPVRLEPGDCIESVLQTTRIGLSENKGADKPWRFVDSDLRAWASRR